MAVVTLKERKDREASRRRAAARAVIDELRSFVEATGHVGRFIVFGSTAAGTMRFTSDFDVIVDFPREWENKAYSLVEDACGRERIPADIHSTSLVSDEFVREMLTRSVEVVD